MNEDALLAQLKKTNRMYAVISNVNSMILHLKDCDLIFKEACRIAVEEGQFLMSWIGQLDEETKTLTPVQWAGKVEGYLSAIPPISIEDIPTGRGPTGTAFRTGQSCVAHDFQSEPSLIPWQKEGAKRGYASSIAIPIKVNHRVIGTFTIYSAESHFFNLNEINQLEALTDNIAFAIETIENEKSRKTAEALIHAKNEELSRIHDRYVSLLENMREGLQLISYDYRYLFLNQAVLNQGKSSRDKLSGKTMMECYPGIETTELFSRLQESMNKRIPQTFENIFTFPDGTKEWFELRFSPVPEGLLILSLDVTERKKIEDDLLQSNKERADELLHNASKMSALGEMAAGIAHEINNPLSIIIMQATQLLKKHQIHDLEKASFEEGLVKISSTAQRIGKVVKGLSAISRNTENDPMKEVSISLIVEDTIGLCLEKFNSHSIEFKKSISSLKRHTILARPPLVMQVLLNLFNNAFDAVLPLDSKWIELIAEVTEKTVTIQIIDSGEGISDQLLTKIMQPFFTTKEPGKGTGLGLSTSKGIIEDHGGKLYYQKVSGHTCFAIELPLFRETK
ncbi:MAG: GAF domain-containing protein [Bacteriovorax sp.]|jgi:PAS domain S-box-containing protein|nr:GAF domain-containing protein [Bacteriovorax sp.]